MTVYLKNCEDPCTFNFELFKDITDLLSKKTNCDDNETNLHLLAVTLYSFYSVDLINFLHCIRPTLLVHLHVKYTIAVQMSSFSYNKNLLTFVVFPFNSLKLQELESL